MRSSKFRCRRLPLLGCFFLLLALISGAARADVFGAWSGQLAFSDSGGRSESWGCVLEITRTPTMLFVSDRNWCTYMHRELEISEGRLMLAGRQIGTISAGRIEVRENRAEYLYYFTAQLGDSGELLISDVFHDWEGNHSEKVSGPLRMGSKSR